MILGCFWIETNVLFFWDKTNKTGLESTNAFWTHVREKCTETKYTRQIQLTKLFLLFYYQSIVSCVYLIQKHSIGFEFDVQYPIFR